MGEEYSFKLNELLNMWEARLHAIPASEMSYRSNPNKWSKKEILGHLIDSAYNNHQRILQAEHKDDMIFEGYDQVDWVVKNKYQNRDENEIIDLFISSNRHLAYLISGLKEEVVLATTTFHNFDKICMKLVDAGKPSSLAYLIEDYIFHLEHHLGQILDN